MEIDYEELLDIGQQLMAELAVRLEESPNDEESKEMRGFLIQRHDWLRFLSQRG